MEIDKDQFAELLGQMLETELGGTKVYETALQCVVNEELKEEWQKYLAQTHEHADIVAGLMEHFGLDTTAETLGRAVVRHIGVSLVKAMELALEDGPAEAAQLVATECVVHAETKDHLNWELLAEIVASRALKGEDAQAVKKALEKVEEQEDEHLYHSQGWSRELWIDSLGMPAVLPPPEEEKDVKTAIGAARAKKARRDML
jgi:ferritin-like metal-binding protein YciE